MWRKSGQKSSLMEEIGHYFQHENVCESSLTQTTLGGDNLSHSHDSHHPTTNKAIPNPAQCCPM